MAGWCLRASPGDDSSLLSPTLPKESSPRLDASCLLPPALRAGLNRLFRPVIWRGARRKPAACGTFQGSRQRRVSPTPRAFPSLLECKERCPPRHKSRGEHLEAKVELLLTYVAVETLKREFHRSLPTLKHLPRADSS